MQSNRIRARKVLSNGFSLTELMITVVIVGILGAVALPNYQSQMQRSRQTEAASTVSQLQNTLVAYVDEFGEEPGGWSDLNDISAVMTADGPANAANFDEAIELPGGNYEVSVVNANGRYTFTATPTAEDVTRNVMACVDLNNGASDLRKDSSNVEADDLVCWEPS